MESGRSPTLLAFHACILFLFFFFFFTCNLIITYLDITLLAASEAWVQAVHLIMF
jgi:hypothetical protein